MARYTWLPASIVSHPQPRSTAEGMLTSMVSCLTVSSLRVLRVRNISTIHITVVEFVSLLSSALLITACEVLSKALYMQVCADHHLLKFKGPSYCDGQLVERLLKIFSIFFSKTTPDLRVSATYLWNKNTWPFSINSEYIQVRS